MYMDMCVYISIMYIYIYIINTPYVSVTGSFSAPVYPSGLFWASARYPIPWPGENHGMKLTKIIGSSKGKIIGFPVENHLNHLQMVGFPGFFFRVYRRLHLKIANDAEKRSDFQGNLIPSSGNVR